MFGSHQRIGLAICSPHRKTRLANGKEIVETITVDWHRARNALSLPTNINTLEWFADGMEIGEARDSVAKRCLEHTPRPEYLFFLDNDVLPSYDALTKLFFRLQTNPKIDIAAGVYCCKNQVPSDPLIYSDFGIGPFWEWTIGDLLTTDQHNIRGVHMGLTLIRVSLFQRMIDNHIVDDNTPFFKTINESTRVNGALKTRRGTEDLYFCDLATKVDCKIMIDTSVLAGHIDKNTGITWGLPENSPPAIRTKWLQTNKQITASQLLLDVENILLNDNADDIKAKFNELKSKMAAPAPTKLALDLGAGSTRRTWADHKTFTTDIRANTNADYIQDSRWLNLPENHFDLVASSHHLEHIGRWDQNKVWAEIYRVCKAGGAIEHIVPSIEWAAFKVVNNELDEHVYNVLYGAQEAHGYEREYNLHYFGYTKEIAKALATEAGFINVVCEDWRDDPNLHYNLIIRGEKPNG